MKYYLDITFLEDSEITLGFIWQKVFQQVHIALVENKTPDNGSEIAVSFPEYGNKYDNSRFPLGKKLRLLASTEETLEKLMISRCLKLFGEYTHINSIKTVPTSVNTYACFSRKQFKTNLTRLARRRAKRHNETFEKAMQFYVNFEDEKSNLPFININSLSKGRTFKLFIGRELIEQSQVGEFTCYGLSKTNATIPWF